MSDVRWRGVPIDEMSQEDLVTTVEDLMATVEEYRRPYAIRARALARVDTMKRDN